MQSAPNGALQSLQRFRAPPRSHAATIGATATTGGVVVQPALAANGMNRFLQKRNVQSTHLAATNNNDSEDEDSDDDDPLDEDHGENDEMVAEMQRSTGLEYDEVVKLLRDYRRLKDTDTVDVNDDGTVSPRKGHQPAPPQQSRLPRTTPATSATAAARSVPRMPPPTQTSSSASPATGSKEPSVSTRATDETRAERQRLQNQLDDLLGDIHKAKAANDAEALAAERAIAAKAERDRMAQDTVAAGYLTHGPVETPSSLVVRDKFVKRYEAESAAKREAQELAEEQKRAKAEEEARERQARGFVSNMAIRKRIESGKHLASSATTTTTRVGKGGNVQHALAKDLALAKSKEWNRDRNAGTGEIELDEDGLPRLLPRDTGDISM
jgi:hypothetical protein